jgi:hypothetical protein
MAGLAYVLEHRAVQYRRTFRSSVFTSFLTPLLFLTAMGIGLGGYVTPSSTALLGGVTYLQFLAPGLLVATSMQSAAFEATFPIIGGLNWQRTFHAMYATPLSPLYHGVVVTRALVFGVADMAPILMLIHLSILVGFVTVGTVASVRLIERRLVRG